MFGWNGKFLRVNLSKNKAVAEEYGASIAKNFLGVEVLQLKFFGMSLNLELIHCPLKIDSFSLLVH